jgi:hypothetical protein
MGQHKDKVIVIVHVGESMWCKLFAMQVLWLARLIQIYG